MNRKLTLPLAVLALSLGITPMLSGAEADAPPPPVENAAPDAPPPGGPRRGGMRALPPMSEEEKAKFDELATKVQEALKAYKENPSDENLSALKEKIAAQVEARAQLEVERAQKALDRAKERLANKDQEVEKQLKRMTQPRRARPVGKRDGAPMYFGADKPKPVSLEKILTENENREVRELRGKLRGVESVTPEVTKKVKALNAIFQKALKRNEEALEKAKKAKKETAELEHAVTALQKMVSETKDAETYVKVQKSRPVDKGRKDTKK